MVASLRNVVVLSSTWISSIRSYLSFVYMTVQVPRKRLGLDIVNKAFKCDTHYLMDKTRSVFFPHEWKTKLLPWADGVTYRIVVKSEGPVAEDPFDEYE